MIPLWLLEHTNTFFLQYRLLWRNQFVDYPQGHHPPSCISFAYGLLGFFLALAYTNQIYWLISSRKQGLAWPRLRPISKCEYTTGGLNVAFGIQYQQYRRINTFHYWPIYLFNRTPSFRCLAWKNNRPASGAVGRERGGTPIRRFFSTGDALLTMFEHFRLQQFQLWRYICVWVCIFLLWLVLCL